MTAANCCPAARSGIVQVNEAMRERIDAPPSGGIRYMLLFVEGPEFEGDPDGAKYRAMTRWTDELKDEKKYVECAGLAKSPPAARIETRAGKTAVSDGPFAEVKEHLAGFFLVDCASRERAVEVAAQIPEATLGLVEVRHDGARVLYRVREPGVREVIAEAFRYAGRVKSDRPPWRDR